MFSNLSILGWVIIIGLAVFILVLNLGLLLGVPQRMQKKHEWVDKMTNAGQVLRHPLRKENDRLQALSDQVSKLKPSIDENGTNSEEVD